MAPLKFRKLGRRAGLLDGVLPDLFQHLEARRASISLVAIDQALRQQGVETVEDPDAQVLVSAHRLSRFEREPAREDGQPTEQLSFGAIEQVIAPADRGGQRLLARGQIPRSTDKEGQCVFKALQEDLWRQHPQAGRRELDRQWQTIQTRANLGDD